MGSGSRVTTTLPSPAGIGFKVKALEAGRLDLYQETLRAGSPLTRNRARLRLEIQVPSPLMFQPDPADLVLETSLAELGVDARIAIAFAAAGRESVL